MKFSHLLLVIGFIFTSNLYAQDGIIENYHLSHIQTDTERAMMSDRSFTETAPPTGTVRNIAEWEDMESVIIAYDGGFGVPYSLIAEMSENCMITTIVANTSEKNTVLSYYEANGVTTSNCNFVFQDPDSYWTRDYSPWFIATDNEVAIVNFPYNRPRPNDNDVPILMADFLDIDLYGMNLTHTGGNYMCDGYGAAASTDLVTDEEELSLAEINTKMQDYLGIDNYHVTLDPLDDYIKHIDCWGKYIDVDKVLITQVPTSDYRYADYEAVANYFATQNCSWGYPYEVIRVQAADDDDDDVNPYTNSLILNNKVFVPQTGSSLDDDALAVYEEAMPGYEVIGVNSSSWINSDALHCRTHGVADTEMLFIKHYPIYGAVDYQENFEIQANVVSYGGSAITTGFPKLFYRQNSGTWEEVVMTSSGENNYTANISGLSGDNNVEYYISAENDNSKTATQPRMGELDAFQFSYSDGSASVTTKDEISFYIYPNPNNGSFKIESTFANSKITIYNTKGQIVYTSVITDSIINIASLSSGIYIAKLESDKQIGFEKLIVE